jgi:hypothetical protein
MEFSSSRQSRTWMVAGVTVLVLGAATLFWGCTQEWQNTISRSIQNWTGTDGVLDVVSEGKVLYRFLKIDKLSTATATADSTTARAYRFGYGVFDKNFNFIADPDEKRVYFEVSDYATSYVFYENPY